MTAMHLRDQQAVPQLVEKNDPIMRSPRDAALDKLRRVPLLAGVPELAINRFVAKSHYRDYTAGEVIVDLGDASYEVFLIIEGAVRVVARTASGYEAILNELGAGEFFGELAAIDGTQRSANVTALQRTRLCIVPAEAFIELALFSAEVGLRLLRLLSTRLRVKDERLIEFSVFSVRQRLISELLRLSRDRGGGERVLSPPPPQHVLAAWIGTRRESVSRELAEMSRAGLLTIGRQSIVLHSPEQLLSEVSARMGGKTRSNTPTPQIERRVRPSRQ
jgi:CRP/FNR family transcriptional regulator, cyclic AMP receptor protein